MKSAAPAFASPAACCFSAATVPTTVWAVGITVCVPPQPASTKARARNGATRRIGASLLKPSAALFASRQQPKAERREPSVAGDVGRRVVDQEADGACDEA